MTTRLDNDLPARTAERHPANDARLCAQSDGVWCAVAARGPYSVVTVCGVGINFPDLAQRAPDCPDCRPSADPDEPTIGVAGDGIERCPTCRGTGQCVSCSGIVETGAS